MQYAHLVLFGMGILCVVMIDKSVLEPETQSS